MGNRYLDFEHRSRGGLKSVSVIGDSVGAGVNTGNACENSFVGMLRNAVNAYTGVNNHGYCSVRGKYWGNIVSYDMHGFPEYDRALWRTETRNQFNLGWDGFTSCKKGASLTFTPSEKYRYFSVHYRTGGCFGSFSVAGMSETVDCSAGEYENGQTTFAETSCLPDGKIILTVESDGRPVTFTGITYMNDLNAVTVNSYCAGGLRFGGEGDNVGQNGVSRPVMDIEGDCGTLIFELGGNDAHFEPDEIIDRPIFKAKIDYLTDMVKRNRSSLIVFDTIWYIPGKERMNKEKIDFYKSELVRFAREANGVYVDVQGILGDSLLRTIADGAHPDADGQRLMGRLLLDTVFSAK